MTTEEPRNRGSNDNQKPGEGAGLLDDLVMGLRFFSRLPTGEAPHRRPNLDRIALALPFASLIIGIGPALMLAGGLWLKMPGLVVGALAVAALLLVTGAMAEDGLADAADGLFGGATPERRLEILKDSRHGTYGVAALCLFLLLRVSAVAALGVANPLAAGGAWLGAQVLARSGALALTVVLPPARPDGASAAAGRTSKQTFAIGLAFAVPVAFALSAPFVGILAFVLALALAVATVCGWTVLCRRLVGGQTGDLIGALQALIEIAVLTGFVIVA